MINDLKSNPQYKKVLEENMIFVSDYSKYGNTSSQYGDFCFIKEHPYYNPESGTTSYASPQALCYINQVIKGTIGEDGKNITAVQALAAVKAAIRQNSNGELDLDEALAMARYMYSPHTNSWDGTSWSFTGILTLNDDGYTSPVEAACSLRVNSVSNNDIMISFSDVMDDLHSQTYSENCVIDGNGNLVYTASSVGGYSNNVDGNWQVTFVQTSTTTATAEINSHFNGGYVRIFGLLQGTLTNP